MNAIIEETDLIKIDQLVNSRNLGDREKVLTNCNLNTEQIKNLYNDPKNALAQLKIIENITKEELTNKQVCNLLATDIYAIKKALFNRMHKDNDFIGFNCTVLKYEYNKWRV